MIADAYPKTVVLADGAHLLLRAVEPTDAGELVVRAWDGASVAGQLRLRRGAGGRADVATVEVTLEPAYRGRRLGTWMLLDAIHVAEALGVARLVAEVGDGDAALAEALVRLDFVDPAALDDRPLAPAGRVLAKRLHVAWTDF